MTHECKLKATNPTELEETEGKLYFDQMDDGMVKVKRSLHGRGGGFQGERTLASGFLPQATPRGDPVISPVVRPQRRQNTMVCEM
jgi:hypothetical protein